MTRKELARHWYLKGAKDSETTEAPKGVSLNQIMKDFETHFELQYPSDCECIPEECRMIKGKCKNLAYR